MQPISEIAARLAIADEHLVFFGRDKAKVRLEAMNAPRQRSGQARLVLVSGITPTPAGEGKTTTTIGVGDALSEYRLDRFLETAGRVMARRDRTLSDGMTALWTRAFEATRELRSARGVLP